MSEEIRLFKKYKVHPYKQFGTLKTYQVEYHIQ